MESMKKVFLAILVVGASALYIFTRTPTSAAPTMPTDTTVATTPTAPTGSVPPPESTPAATAPAPAPAPATNPKAAFKDGSYTGSSVNAFYGYVQVKATVSGGKLADVTFLSYPSDRDTSRYINSQAMPMLTEEAISAQSANVDLIGGATDTSLAFRQSLRSALAKAANS